MRFDVVTLFPELFAPHLTLGITRRAFDGGQVDVRRMAQHARDEGPGHDAAPAIEQTGLAGQRHAGVQREHLPPCGVHCP